MAGIEATRDPAKLLKATEKQASAGQQGYRESYLDADEEPLHGISPGHL